MKSIQTLSTFILMCIVFNFSCNEPTPIPGKDIYTKTLNALNIVKSMKKPYEAEWIFSELVPNITVSRIIDPKIGEPLAFSHQPKNKAFIGIITRKDIPVLFEGNALKAAQRGVMGFNYHYLEMGYIFITVLEEAAIKYDDATLASFLVQELRHVQQHVDPGLKHMNALEREKDAWDFQYDFWNANLTGTERKLLEEIYLDCKDESIYKNKPQKLSNYPNGISELIVHKKCPKFIEKVYGTVSSDYQK